VFISGYYALSKVSDLALPQEVKVHRGSSNRCASARLSRPLNPLPHQANLWKNWKVHILHAYAAPLANLFLDDSDNWEAFQQSAPEDISL